MAGHNTPQYGAVLQKLLELQQRLQVNVEAKLALTLNFRMENWLGAGTNPEPARLIELALNRIQTDSKQYDIFIRMLRVAGGMDDIADQITGIIAILLCSCLSGTKTNVLSRDQVA